MHNPESGVYRNTDVVEWLNREEKRDAVEVIMRIIESGNQVDSNSSPGTTEWEWAMELVFASLVSLL